MYREIYSYARTYIDFTGSGVCEILKGEPSLVETRKGKAIGGAIPKVFALGYWTWGRIPPPWLVYCVLPLRILRIPLARLVGQAVVVYRKVKVGATVSANYSICYSKWALSEI